MTARQEGNTITFTTNRRLESVSLALFFDTEVTGWSTRPMLAALHRGRKKEWFKRNRGPKNNLDRLGSSLSCVYARRSDPTLLFGIRPGETLEI